MGVALIRDVIQTLLALIRDVICIFESSKHSNFYSYDVWAGRTLIQEMWFGKYFVSSASKLMIENFWMKKLMLNCLLQIHISGHNCFSNNINEKLTPFLGRNLC